MLEYTEAYTLTDHVKDIHYQVSMIPKALAFIYNHIDSDESRDVENACDAIYIIGNFAEQMEESLNRMIERVRHMEEVAA